MVKLQSESMKSQDAFAKAVMVKLDVLVSSSAPGKENCIASSLQFG